MLSFDLKKEFKHSLFQEIFLDPLVCPKFPFWYCFWIYHIKLKLTVYSLIILRIPFPKGKQPPLTLVFISAPEVVTTQMVFFFFLAELNPFILLQGNVGWDKHVNSISYDVPLSVFSKFPTLQPILVTWKICF